MGSPFRSLPLRILVVGAGVGGISVARGLLRDGHHVTVFEQRPDARAGGGAVTIWPNGATVLEQLGVDMDGAGQLLSTVRVVTSAGRPLVALDLTAIVDRLGASVRMVPRRVLLERLLAGFPTDHIQYDRRAAKVASTPDGVRVEFANGSVVEGDLLIGADGLHSKIRDVVGVRLLRPTLSRSRTASGFTLPSRTPSRSFGTATFSHADRVGNRLKNWKMNPTR